jgi:hypothetical protein
MEEEETSYHRVDGESDSLELPAGLQVQADEARLQDEENRATS